MPTGPAVAVVENCWSNLSRGEAKGTGQGKGQTPAGESQQVCHLHTLLRGSFAGSDVGSIAAFNEADAESVRDWRDNSVSGGLGSAVEAAYKDSTQGTYKGTSCSGSTRQSSIAPSVSSASSVRSVSSVGTVRLSSVRRATMPHIPEIIRTSPTASFHGSVRSASTAASTRTVASLKGTLSGRFGIKEIEGVIADIIDPLAPRSVVFKGLTFPTVMHSCVWSVLGYTRGQNDTSIATLSEKEMRRALKEHKESIGPDWHESKVVSALVVLLLTGWSFRYMSKDLIMGVDEQGNGVNAYGRALYIVRDICRVFGTKGLGVSTLLNGLNALESPHPVLCTHIAPSARMYRTCLSAPAHLVLKTRHDGAQAASGTDMNRKEVLTLISTHLRQGVHVRPSLRISGSSYGGSYQRDTLPIDFDVIEEYLQRKTAADKLIQQRLTLPSSNTSGQRVSYELSLPTSTMCCILLASPSYVVCNDLFPTVDNVIFAQLWRALYYASLNVGSTADWVRKCLAGCMRTDFCCAHGIPVFGTGENGSAQEGVPSSIVACMTGDIEVLTAETGTHAGICLAQGSYNSSYVEVQMALEMAAASLFRG
ncbi:hypothetical protein FPV67DRAFT_1664231 [Lyophyllum atratum]|nr:hypothetical protein FPV67DRAFT_1664231 [Lyophyllum atratum]